MSKQCQAKINIRGKGFQCGLPANHECKHKAFEDWSGPLPSQDFEVALEWTNNPEATPFGKWWDKDGRYVCSEASKVDHDGYYYTGKAAWNARGRADKELLKCYPSHYAGKLKVLDD